MSTIHCILSSTTVHSRSVPLKVSRSQAKIYEHFAKNLLKTKAKIKCFLLLKPCEGLEKHKWVRAVKSKPKVLRHFKVDPVLKIYETVYIKGKVKKSSVQWRVHVEFHKKKNILFKLDKFELFCKNYFVVNWHWLVFGAISSLDRRLYDKFIIYTLSVTISLFGLSIFCFFIKLKLKALSAQVRIKNQCLKFFYLVFEVMVFHLIFWRGFPQTWIKQL